MGAASIIRAAALLLVVATPAVAQEGPRFCPNRPSVGTSTCITDSGRVLVEVSGIDWQRDGTMTSTLFGDLLLRTGIDDRTEAQVGWTPLSHLVSRDDRRRDVATGVGDVRLGLRRSLLRPDGDGLSIALEGFVTLPTAASVAWEVRPQTQVDPLVAAGLTAQTPDLRIVLGGAVLF